MRSVLVLLVLSMTLPLAGQWSLPEVVRRAGERAPAVEVSFERMAEAAAGVQLARTAYLPKVDSVAQINRATRNNVFGMLLPQSVIAPISGPPLATNAGTNVWGTATGLLVSWEPFDLGRRKAKIGVAEAERRLQQTAYARVRFEAEAAAADLYLTLLAAGHLVEGAEAGLARAEALVKMTGALAGSGLKPGSDLGRARQERIAAEALLIQAKTAERTARAALIELLGEEAAAIQADPAPFASPPWKMEDSAGRHPLLAEQDAAAGVSEARRKELAKAWAPRFLGQSALYARGTGARGDGTTGGAWSGIGPNIYNWGVGLTVLFPLGDLPAVRAERQAEAHRFAAESARVRQVSQKLSAEVAQARARLEGARELVPTAAAQLSASGEVYEQMQARYRGGLAPLMEVVEAQRAYQQAGVDDALARLAVWRAQLGVAIAEGDLGPFLKLLEKR